MRLVCAALLSVIALVVVPAASFAVDIGNLHCNDASGNNLNVGLVVTVTGVVTDRYDPPPPSHAARLYMQDATGGINVFGTTGYCGNLGDNITVTGRILQFYGGVEVYGDDTTPLIVTLNSTGNPQPAPIGPLEPAQVAATFQPSYCEPNESILAMVGPAFIRTSTGAMPAPGATFGGLPPYAGVAYRLIHAGPDSTTNYTTLFIAKPASPTCVQTNPLLGQPIPMACVMATGVLAQYDGSLPYTSDYEIIPRLLSDLSPTVEALPAATCITPSHACVQVPVVISRPDATPVRGFSVTVQLSSELSVCAPGIVAGSYLDGTAPTHFETTDNGGGRWTIDGAILGLPCGATAPYGTLFTLNLGSSVPAGPGSVTVTSVTLRDCDNGPVACYPGPVASIPIDNVVPGPVTLAAAQLKSGNAAGSTTRVNLSWTGSVTAGDKVEIYRAPYGQYPEYDMGGAVPAVPSYPPPLPWQPAGIVTAPLSTFSDLTGTRDFWYYVAFVKDPCGSVGACSNRTNGTLNYFLGDVSDGYTQCLGNNAVAGEDLSLLGSHYGAALADPDPLGCLDVGPTTNYSVDARPVPDDRINFEDLMVFAINDGTVSAPQAAAVPMIAPAGDDAVWVDAPARVAAGETFALRLRMRGAGDVQGLSARLSWNGEVAEPVSVEPGELLASGGVALSSGPGDVDVAMLGHGRGIAGEGVVAIVWFRARTDGTPAVTLAALDARDLANQKVSLAGPHAQVPGATALEPAQPNPFHQATALRFTLAHGGPAELTVFAVDGRRVATLASGPRAAGVWQMTWTGRDDDGQPVRPGMYFVRLTTPEGRLTRTLVLVR